MMTKFSKCVAIDTMLDRLGLEHVSYKLLGNYYTARKIDLLYKAFFCDDYVLESWNGKFHGFHKKINKIVDSSDEDNIITYYD